ncbi:HDOD domain-containing protein [Ideonella sp. DXS22W]|uniref:HDOD domain-containing protein n=1 Tax=Pseudaquabacterium inlustre TaxID=2984192 RepID=A0ABU9CHI7_9BURK
MNAPTSSERPAAAGQAVRRLGRFQLLRLLAKTQQSMMWLVSEPRFGREWVLVIPRRQPEDADALQAWLQTAQRASRIDHPGLARPVEIGEQERWPYVAYERDSGVLLSERIGRSGLPGTELAPLAIQLLEGLAMAHEAGVAHRDLHAAMVLLHEGGGAQLLGLGVVQSDGAGGLPAQRRAAEQDVLAFGLVMHHGLVGEPALQQPDVMQVVAQMPPLGREFVRLPRGTGPVIPDPLRAIVNRATDRQERQRYRSARTLERALSGWLRAAGDGNLGPLALLTDRMRSAGLLPGMPGGARRAARLALMDRERTFELAAVVLEDVGLCFELLRQVNSAAVRGAMGAGSGPILTVRRAIALLGLDSVRQAAQAMKPWPGALGEAQAQDLSQQFALARQAGRIAQMLRPAGYDAELCYLLALLQRLGRLLVQYHFPEEAAQIRRLMLPAPSGRPDEPEDPGMSEESASFAVLGIDVESLATAVGRQWGLDDDAQHMMRRMPLDAPVRAPHSDTERLRITASAANELVDSQLQPLHHRAAAQQRVAQRYGRALDVSLADLQQALLGEPPTEPATLGPRPVDIRPDDALDDTTAAPAAAAMPPGRSGAPAGAPPAAAAGSLAARLADARRAARQGSTS